MLYHPPGGEQFFFEPQPTHPPECKWLFINYARWMMSKYIIGCLVCAYLWAPNIRYKVENDLFGGPRHISVLV